MTGNSRYYLSNECCVFLPEISFVSSLVFSEDFEGYLFQADPDFFNQAVFTNKLFLLQKYVDNLYVYKFSSFSQYLALENYIRLIQSLQLSEPDDTSDSCRMIQNALLVKLLSYFESCFSDNVSQKFISRNEAIAKNFVELVHENYLEHRDLSFYSDKLCISTKYLSYIVSKVTGKKANAWIVDCVCSHAKRLLKTSNLTINQIADTLNYHSTSDFCRTFRRNTGMSPLQYRLDC